MQAIRYEGGPSDALEPTQNPWMETAKERRTRKLKELCDKHGLAEVARKAGVSAESLEQVLKGVLLPPKKDGTRSARSLGDRAAHAIEDEYDLGRGWFDASDAAPIAAIHRERPAIPLDNNPDYPAIPRVRFKLSAGASGFEVDYLSNGDGAPIVFRRDWYEKRNLKPEALFAIRVCGSSMEPGLYQGDTVVVNTADIGERDGEVYAVNYEGELVIKRLVRDAGQWWLASDNPDQRRYSRKECHDGVTLIGRIVHKQSERI